MRSLPDYAAPVTRPTRSYGCPPTIMRLLLTVEAVAMDWISVDPLLVRAVLLDLRMRLVPAR